MVSRQICLGELKIDNPIGGFSAAERFHPLFLYESIGTLLLCLFLFALWRFQRDRLQHGDFFMMYIMGYALIRFALEFIRIDIPTVGDINVSQVVTGLAFVVAAGGFFLETTLRRNVGLPPIW